MTTSRTPRKRVGRAEREQQILEAALAVFSERGIAAATMDAVAERVGVTKPVLYTHFGSKEGLLLACITRLRGELLAVISRAAAESDDTEDMLRRGVRAFFDYMEQRTTAFTMLDSEAAVPPEALEQIRAEQTDFLAGLLAAQVPGADPQRLTGWAQVVVGACERLAVWRAHEPGVTAEQATGYLMDLAWTGLRGLAPPAA